MELILQDAGERVTEDDDLHMFNTGAAECARPNIDDFIVFIGDLNVLCRIKALAREHRFKEDTLGGDLKAGLAQYVAIEIAQAQLRSTSRSQSSVVVKYLPWLYTPPSTTSQAWVVA